THRDKQLTELVNMHNAEITDTNDSYDKPTYHKHQPDQPVHSPNLRLTYKDQGKTVTESLPTPAAQKKADREIGEFRHFEQLIRAFIEINAKICRARSLEEQPTSQGKKRRRRTAKKPRAN